MLRIKAAAHPRLSIELGTKLKPRHSSIFQCAVMQISFLHIQKNLFRKIEIKEYSQKKIRGCTYTVSHFSYAPLIKCKIIQKRNKIFLI